MIGSFTQADHLRLRKAARILCGGSGYEWNELLNEAVVRALSGTRRCPRSTQPVVFLANAMKSIVSAGRESLALQPETTSLAATGTDGKVLDPPSRQRTVEETLTARDDCAARLAALDDLFKDDEEAQMVILGDIEGLDAEAIRDMQGWTLQELATVRRRIRRRIEARYPTGFPA